MPHEHGDEGEADAHDDGQARRPRAKREQLDERADAGDEHGALNERAQLIVARGRPPRATMGWARGSPRTSRGCAGGRRERRETTGMSPSSLNRFSCTNAFMAELDLARLGVHALHDGERFQAVAAFAQVVAARLEALLDGDADALHRGARLVDELDEAVQRASVRQEVVDDEHMVVGVQELLRHDDVVDATVRERLDACRDTSSPSRLMH